ncbi:MAG TPA: hypothetical protein P5048_00015 [Chlamydiales bacterium]|nr:hypothetical protein [Chlamydiales bacterium]
MSVEKINPSEEPKKKKGVSEAPDTEEFEKLMKVGEVELEKKRKHHGKASEEDEEKDYHQKALSASPYEYDNKSDDEDVHLESILKDLREVSDNDYSNEELKKTAEITTKASSNEKIQEHQKSSKEEEVQKNHKNDHLKKVKEKKIEKDLLKKPSNEMVVSMEEKLEKKSLATPFDLEKEINESSKVKKGEKIFQPPSFIETKYLDKKPLIAPEIKESALKKREKDQSPNSKHIPKMPILLIQHIPKLVMENAQVKAVEAKPYIQSTEIQRLFTQMVGTIMHISQKGIERTEIILDSPNFNSSIFYKSHITFTKYSTAPNSYNIQLTGSDQAVVLFRDNIDSLLLAFRNGKFAFNVGRLEAHYETERPLFKRKKPVSQEESEDQME